MSGGRASPDTPAKRRIACRIRRPRGFTLIELMVAMVLGLIVIAGATSVFLASRQTYRTNQALSDVQESSRIAFELMSRDIRSAGLTGCDNSGRVANVLKNGPNNGGTDWWANWSNTLVGYSSSMTDPAVTVGTGNQQKLSGADSDSILLIGAEGSGYSVKTDTEPAGTIVLNETSPSLATGDVIVVCDPDHSAVVQASSLSGSTITHSASGTPGNCTTDLSYPTLCSSSSGYVFPANSQVAKLSAVDWFIGHTTDGSWTGSSLYRVSLVTTGGQPKPTVAEMVRGVTGMDIGYHLSGGTSFVDAATVAGNWANVDAVQVTLTLQSIDTRAGVNAKPLQRKFSSITTLRNRVN